MKEELYKKLSDLDEQHSAIISNTWATSHGINQALETLLNDAAHIIHPDLSSIHSPVDTKDHSG